MGHSCIHAILIQIIHKNKSFKKERERENEMVSSWAFISIVLGSISYPLVCSASAFFLISFFNDSFFKKCMSIHWCFASCYVCVRVPSILELELQAVMSCRVGTGN